MYAIIPALIIIYAILVFWFGPHNPYEANLVFSVICLITLIVFSYPNDAEQAKEEAERAEYLAERDKLKSSEVVRNPAYSSHK